MVALTEMTNWAVDLIDVRKTYDRNIHALRGVNIQVGREIGRASCRERV